MDPDETTTESTDETTTPAKAAGATESTDEASAALDRQLAQMEANRQALNQQLPVYSRVTRIELFPEEFEKTPTKKIKRFLYTISRG